MKVKNSTPMVIAMIEMIEPTMPVTIPTITNNPSLLNMPNEVSNIPTAGIKLENGTGISTKQEKVIKNNPIILSMIGAVINKSLGLRICSIL